MAMENSTSRRLKESKNSIFYREQKNSYCNIKCFKKLLTSVQKIDLQSFDITHLIQSYCYRTVKGSKGLMVFVVAAMADCIVVAVAFDYYIHNLEILNLTDCSAVARAFDQCIHSFGTRQHSGT